MYDPVHALIHANPKFQQLVHRRERLAWSLSAVMLSLYIAFILLVAFRPDWLGAPDMAGTSGHLGNSCGYRSDHFGFRVDRYLCASRQWRVRPADP